ncbi:hypothetical protein [Haladaptatus halobius]|uniref:hypothetical protein n=1 Tax=Haladaptatus halobius TaxID=2884875 RepID=UPI001D0ABEF9|nr:hypothetical protein [Haladaptatus halobius]
MDQDTNLLGMSRRQLLTALAVGGSVAGGAFLFGDSNLPETRVADPDEAKRLAEAYAPTIYFGKRERWFPTDPRPYTSERDGETVVHGFDAVDGYTADFRKGGDSPRPTAFYHAIEYPGASLSCVQFWFYSVFDQFSTNFHWHDWEVLHVFVDRDESGGTGRPVLFVASAHSQRMPNNEYLDPDVERASIISEVGSHSSTLGLNARSSTFQRTSIDDLSPDINNSPVKVRSEGASLPLAYGLPRDEGAGLAYSIPELDGEPLHEHDRLPNVRPEDMLPDDLTVESFANLTRPPEDIPTRESDTTFVPSVHADAEGDVEYELVDIDAVSNIADFTGPQLSFSFSVPTFAEDAIGKHITSPGAPWDQTRFSNPEEDITDSQHRQALADRYEPIKADGDVMHLLGAIRQAIETEDAPGSNGVELSSPSTEAVAILESESLAVPTFGGVVAILDPPAGDHRLTVNGAGLAPYGETLTVEDGDEALPFENGNQENNVYLGVDGEITTAANEDAVKIEWKTNDGTSLDGLTLDDDFAGRIYDGRPPGEEGRFGVYVHRAGAYTADIRDTEGRHGAVRINPDEDDETVDVNAIETGKAGLADYLIRFLVETREQTVAFEDGSSDGIDDVPTGTDVSDEVVNRASERAKANVGNASGEKGEGNAGNGTGTDKESRGETPSNGTGNSTPTGTPTVSTDTPSPPTGIPTIPTNTSSSQTNTSSSPTNNSSSPTNTSSSPINALSIPTKTLSSSLNTSSSQTDEPNDTDSAGDNDDPGKGFTALLTSFDAALQAAGSARDAAREGASSKADKHLRTVQERLQTARHIADTSDDLPGELSRLAKNRVERMLPRVQMALDSDS